MRHKLTKWRDGKWWLWCEVMEMNVAMRAESETAAYIEAIATYQAAILRRNEELKKLRAIVEAVMGAVEPLREE